MKCLRTLLRGMSHFSSPRRSTGRGAPSVRSSTQCESNQPGLAQSVDILFDGDCPISENLSPKPHWLADDASLESDWSPTANSLLTGKLTGNLVDSGPLPRFRCPVGERIQWLAEKFPTQRNREFLDAGVHPCGETQKLGTGC